MESLIRGARHEQEDTSRFETWLAWFFLTKWQIFSLSMIQEHGFNWKWQEMFARISTIRMWNTSILTFMRKRVFKKETYTKTN